MQGGATALDYYQEWLPFAFPKKEDIVMERPKYNLLQNTCYMLRMAWQIRKSIIGFAVAMVILTVLNSVAELLVVPMILEKVETRVSITELLLTIAGFVGALLVIGFMKSYVNANTMFGHVEFQISMLRRVGEKAGTTSYPNREDAELDKKLDKAADASLGPYSATRRIWTTLTELLINVVGFIVYMLMLTSLQPLLILVILATTVTGYFFNNYMQEYRYRHREEESRYHRHMRYSCNIEGRIEFAKDIRLFGMQSWLDEIFEKTLRAYDAFIMRGQYRHMLGNALDAIMTLLRNGIAYAYLIAQTIEGNLSAAEFLLYFSAVTGFSTWIMGIFQGLIALKEESIEISAMREYLEIPELFHIEGGESLHLEEGASCEIELRDVSFRYPNSEKDSLSHINLTIKRGERLAVVGLNGAGKTTLIKLICGLYDPTEGQVLLNGEDIRKYNRLDYYKVFSVVFQRFIYLPTSVADNVSQSPKFDEERVKSCLQKAGLLERIEELEHGIYQHVGNEVYDDGVNFSGGEMQRLMLARALYKDAPVLLLDEPTAALDAIAENEMYLKYNEMTEGKSSVYISHRLASTRFCDRIIMLAEGRIVEEGTHEKLLQKEGIYADLFHVQSKYYQEGAMKDEIAFAGTENA